MSTPLDRELPLWETWLVEGLDGGRWALVFKVHHCLVDGIAGVDLLGVLLDTRPDPRPTEPQPWNPRPEPGGGAKVVDAWAGLAGETMATARRVAGALVHPVTAATAVVDTARGLARFVADLGPTPAQSLEGTIGRQRAWAHSAVRLDDVRRVRNAFGGTVNDVVLAAVSGGYRDLLLARGEDPDHTVVRSAVPVSTRHDDGHGVADNRVSTVICDLPVGVADPVERLRQVRARMDVLKASHMAEAGEVVTTTADLFPPMAIGSVSRLMTRMFRRVPQRSVNTITTNVPGPQDPLYCLGRRMLEYWPYVPIVHGIRVSTAILSYDGWLSFGVTGDGATVPDVDTLARGTRNAIGQLCERACADVSDR
jgi:diacylglycerol O-acyltransferase